MPIMDKREQAREIVGEVQAIIAAADRQGRELSGHERTAIDEKLSKAARLRTEAAVSEDVMEFGERMGAPSLAGGGGGAGAAFVNSAGYKRIQDPGARTQSFSSGLVEVAVPFQAKGTLLEGSGSPGSGTGGGFVPAPYVATGIVQQLFQPLAFEQLLMSGQATGNTVRYVVQGTATSGAAGVAEGGVKPESTLGFRRGTSRSRRSQRRSPCPTKSSTTPRLCRHSCPAS
jgi:HK97 family phage major capsid protein